MFSDLPPIADIPQALPSTRRYCPAAWLAFGVRDREAGAPMPADAIFRIGSMTKPVTSLAVMMLAEEGRLQIAHPAWRYLPELKGLQVGVETKGEDGKMELALEPARREITVQDLLRHTSGLAHGLFGRSMVKDLYDKARVTDPGQTNAELVSKLAKLPLQFQPGTIWEYSIATEVLGRLVEVVSGTTFDAFVAERITKPLKLADTGFWVEPAKHARIAEAQIDKATGSARCDEPAQLDLGGRWSRFHGAWLVSRKTIELMTADHLPPLRKGIAEFRNPEFGSITGISGALVRSSIVPAGPPRPRGRGSSSIGGRAVCEWSRRSFQGQEHQQARYGLVVGSVTDRSVLRRSLEKQ
jgi:CubicO group peptidase (beta-lactamase class C family)